MSYRLLALTATMLLLTACAPSANETAHSPEARPAESASPSVEPDAAETPTGSACSDPVGDTDVMDLAGVTLALDDEFLTAVFTLAEPMPTSDTAMVGLAVSTKAKDDANYQSRQLGVKTLDGAVIGFFDADLSTGQQTNLDQSNLQIAGSIVTAKFPASVVEQLGAGWQYYAFATAAGADTDACPGEVMSFDQMTFG
jgi:hypothetical protein